MYINFRQDNELIRVGSRIFSIIKYIRGNVIEGMMGSLQVWMLRKKENRNSTLIQEYQ